VAPIHPDATPVLLLDETARETWMNAPVGEALALQRPPPAGALRVVLVGPKDDPGFTITDASAGPSPNNLFG
jgi:putative SOS response-associated peptidase YedK